MELKKNGVYPLIKIKSPPDVNFYSAHKSCIDKNGFVWFCRFGKNNMKTTSLDSCEHILLIKESGIKQGGVFIAEYTELSTELNANEIGIPEYYSGLPQPKALWIKLTSLTPLDYSIFSAAFVVNSSNGSVDNIMRSMCPAFFLRSTSDQELFRRKES
ncbi:MAG: hypothetical protein PHT58_05315 [Eubacteriales bacterium]|nr:hypothetical protein [Eubacteriales bacterium]